MFAVVMATHSDKILSEERFLKIDEKVSVRNFGLNILRKKV